VTDLCLQIQPGRTHGIDPAEVGRVAESLGAASGLVSRFAIVSGEGWTNLMFATQQPAILWGLLWRELFGRAAFAERLRECSMRCAKAPMAGTTISCSTISIERCRWISCLDAASG